MEKRNIILGVFFCFLIAGWLTLILQGCKGAKALASPTMYVPIIVTKTIPAPVKNVDTTQNLAPKCPSFKLGAFLDRMSSNEANRNEIERGYLKMMDSLKNIKHIVKEKDSTIVYLKQFIETQHTQNVKQDAFNDRMIKNQEAFKSARDIYENYNKSLDWQIYVGFATICIIQILGLIIVDKRRKNA